VAGRLLLVDHRVPSGRLAPLPSGSLLPAGVVVRPVGGGADVVGVSVDELVIGADPATVVRVPAIGDGAVTVEVTDNVGNVGTVSVDALVAP
jgi:hypothetical protein